MTAPAIEKLIVFTVSRRHASRSRNLFPSRLHSLALNRLKQLEIPLILASSKTAAEIIPLRAELGVLPAPPPPPWGWATPAPFRPRTGRDVLDVSSDRSNRPAFFIGIFFFFFLGINQKDCRQILDRLPPGLAHPVILGDFRTGAPRTVSGRHRPVAGPGPNGQISAASPSPDCGSATRPTERNFVAAINAHGLSSVQEPDRRFMHACHSESANKAEALMGC